MLLDTVGSEISALVVVLNGILTSLCQLLAIFVIGIGVIKALFIFLKDGLFRSQSSEAFQQSRLSMGYSFSLGLSFLIGSTILKTMISSRWDDIARLATIIAVRTVLNYLLIRAINSSNPEPDAVLDQSPSPDSIPEPS